MNVDVLIATNRPAEELRPVLRSYTQQDTADFSILLITEKQARGLEDLCRELHITNARVVQIPANTSNAAVSRYAATAASASAAASTLLIAVFSRERCDRLCR